MATPDTIASSASTYMTAVTTSMNNAITQLQSAINSNNSVSWSARANPTLASVSTTAPDPATYTGSHYETTASDFTDLNDPPETITASGVTGGLTSILSEQNVVTPTISIAFTSAATQLAIDSTEAGTDITFNSNATVALAALGTTEAYTLTTAELSTYDVTALEEVLPEITDSLSALETAIIDMHTALDIANLPTFDVGIWSAPDNIKPMWEEAFWDTFKEKLATFTDDISNSDDVDTLIGKLTNETTAMQVALYSGDYDRKQQALRDAYRAANRKTAAKGFSYPNSMTIALKLDAQQKYMFDLSQASRDLVKIITEWAKSNYQFTVDKQLSAHNADIDFNTKYQDIILRATAEKAKNILETFREENAYYATRITELYKNLSQRNDIKKVNNEYVKAFNDQQYEKWDLEVKKAEIADTRRHIAKVDQIEENRTIIDNNRFNLEASAKQAELRHIARADRMAFNAQKLENNRLILETDRAKLNEEHIARADQNDANRIALDNNRLVLEIATRDQQAQHQARVDVNEVNRTIVDNNRLVIENNRNIIAKNEIALKLAIAQDEANARDLAHNTRLDDLALQRQRLQNEAVIQNNQTALSLHIAALNADHDAIQAVYASKTASLNAAVAVAQAASTLGHGAGQQVLALVK